MQNLKIKALLVEDNPGDASLLRLSLKGLPAQVDLQHVDQLSLAVVRLQSDPPEVLLLDLNLPDSSGLETVSRAQKASPQVPIVVLTGGDDEAVGMEAVRRGAQDYLVKGQADGRQVIRAIRYAMERKRAEVALRQANDLLELRVRQRTAELESSVTILGEEVSERTRAEHQAMDVQDRFRLMTEAMPAVFWIISDDLSQMHYVSHAYEEIWGRPCQSLYERPSSWRDGVHPDDRERVCRKADALIREARQRKVAPIIDFFRIRRSDDTTIAVVGQGIPVYDGDELRYFAGMVQRQDVFMAGGDEAVIRIDPDGCIRSWNPAAEKLFHIQADQAIGEPASVRVGQHLGRLRSLIGRSRKCKAG